MTTKADFLSNLQTRLNDPTNSRWSDDEQELYLIESVLRYSKLFPLLKEVDFTADGVTNRYPIPSDLVDRRIVKIWEFQDNNRLSEVIPEAQRGKYEHRWYDIIDTAIIFGYIPQLNQLLRMRYEALHALPEAGDSTVPSEDEDLIYLWAEVLAWRKIAASDAALSRWKELGKRDDSPIDPFYLMLSKDYDRLAQEKKAGGRFLQRVIAPRRRQRWGRLFVGE